MDCKKVGNTISKLRKKCGLTQQTLAQMLDVTDKAISRWENGLGYPDVTIFPRLADIFGVSIDYLMLGDKKGITVAGNMVMDIVKNISDYPNMGMLSYITDTSYAVGGCAPNTATNLSKIDPSIPIDLIGKVGADENGRYILSRLRQYGINVDKVSVSQTLPTSFSDVMSIPSGERTFFHQRGANAAFSPEDVDISALRCDLLHIGYVLLLDSFDADDPKYGTVMARFLHSLQKAGIKTSIDMVSDSTADYSKKMLPVLKYCNYVIINEIECCGIWKLNPYDKNGNLDKEIVYKAMRQTMECGVKDRLIVHSKKISFIIDKDGNITEVPSLKIPKEEIKGSVGAGDAFCAGCLFAIYNGYSDKQLLEFASAAAACNLFSANAVDGMRNKTEIMKIAEKYGRHEL